MNSVNMDKYCVNNESNNNNSENSKEDSTTLEEKEGKGKNYNAYTRIMTGQETSAAINHFDGCM